MSATQIFKLYNYVYDSRIHLLEMIADRGYDVSHLTEYTIDEIKHMLEEHISGKFDSSADIGPLDIYLEKQTGASIEKIYVKYRLDVKFKSNNSLTTQITSIYENHLTTKDTLIIINVSRILKNPGIKDKADEDFSNKLLITKNYFIQLFGLENFLINVSRHQFVPKHRILSKLETQAILSQFNCSITNIPTIKRDDAQAKYIGLRPKQVCEIQVENVTSGVTTRYRLCVN